MSIEMKRTIFMLVGMIIGASVGLIAVKLSHKNHKFKAEYDERQQIMIGRSYKWAAITSWVLMLIYMSIEMGGMPLPIDRALIIFSIVFISLLVFASYAIWTDAFFGTNAHYGRYAIVFVLIGILNLAVAIMTSKENLMVVDGVVTASALSVEGVALSVVVGIELWAKSIVEKKKNDDLDDEEDEDEE